MSVEDDNRERAEATVSALWQLLKVIVVVSILLGIWQYLT